MCENSGRVAMNITLQAGWSALDAVLRETPTNKTSQAKILLHHQVLGVSSFIAIIYFFDTHEDLNLNYEKLIICLNSKRKKTKKKNEVI